MSSYIYASYNRNDHICCEDDVRIPNVSYNRCCWHTDDTACSGNGATNCCQATSPRFFSTWCVPPFVLLLTVRAIDCLVSSCVFLMVEVSQLSILDRCLHEILSLNRRASQATKHSQLSYMGHRIAKRTLQQRSGLLFFKFNVS